MPVHGAGYGGFRVARRPGGEDPGVVVRHPAGPGVVRRGGKGRTDRTGARGTVRKHLARMAWRWLHHQPHGALSGWSVQYVSARDGRPGRRGIVALARRLPGAPVRFATTGLAHGGAVLSKAPA